MLRSLKRRWVWLLGLVFFLVLAVNLHYFWKINRRHYPTHRDLHRITEQRNITQEQIEAILGPHSRTFSNSASGETSFVYTIEYQLPGYRHSILAGYCFRFDKEGKWCGGNSCEESFEEIIVNTLREIG